MAIDYDPITADLITLATSIRAISSAFTDFTSEINSNQSKVEDKTTAMDSAALLFVDYSNQATAAISEKNSLINSVLAIQEEVSFSGPAETNESLEAYYE